MISSNNMENQFKSFNEIPGFLCYEKRKREYYYYPIIIKEEDGLFSAMYALHKDNEFGTIVLGDYLFKVTGISYEDAACRLSLSFDKEPVKSHVKGREWLLDVENGYKKQLGLDMDEHVRPNSFEE